MPIYLYQCEECGKRFEKLRLAGREQELRCIKCGGVRLKKLPASFRLWGKGSSSEESKGSSCSTCFGGDCSTCR
jgi:putative FmdB family regulatory protein